MGDSTADLRSYYEEEARRGLRSELVGQRLVERNDFIALLRAESRTSIIDFGAGPGHDIGGFAHAGIAGIGLDLAHGNGVLAAGNGLVVLQSSIAAPPLRPGSFAAGWCMSTLMHVPEADVPATLVAMAAVLAAGAPLVVGQWGGSLGDLTSHDGIEGEQRLFSLRSFERNCALLAQIGELERSEIWPTGPDGWEYHLCQVRAQPA